MIEQTLTVSAEEGGRRLDAVLARLMPGVGLRGRRRAAEAGRVLVDGAAQAPGYRVHPGQMVALAQRQAGLAHCAALAVPPRGVAYAAVVKPPGMHTAALAGSEAPCLEDCLPDLFPDADPRLLNRLDRATSGLVLVGFGPGAEAGFRTLEDAGAVTKDYLALVRGHVEAPLLLDRALDTADRARTRVLEEPAGPLRVTRAEPLRRCGPDTLLAVRIAKGARHQIRAHLAHAGLPIVGDVLYGDAGVEQQAARLFLHHRAVALEGFSAAVEPDWELEEG